MWMPEEKLGPFEIVRSLSVESALHPVYLVRHTERPGERETLTFPYQPQGFRANVLNEQASRWQEVFSGPGLVPITSLQILKGRLSVRAPFYPEGSLERLRKTRGPLPALLVCDALCQALEGLKRLHAAGIIHGRFHPRNLLRDGATVRLAGASFAPFLYPITEADEALAVDRYISPEGREGQRPHIGSDIWAVGKTLEALLLGSGKGLTPVVLPMVLRAVLQCCLATNPAERYPSAQALHGALLALRPSLAEAARPQPVAPRPAPLALPMAQSQHQTAGFLSALKRLFIGGITRGRWEPVK